MTGDGAEIPQDPLADALAAYDDRLAAGAKTTPEQTELDVDPALLPDWQRLTAFLSLVEKAWPRTESQTSHRPADAQTIDPGSTAALEPATTEVDGDRRFGRFQIQRTLGQGGFGIVFLAWDPTLRRRVALKVPQPETLVTPDARKRFQREALAAAGLDHPNIVPVYESGSIGAVAYIAAAYIAGPTLSLWLTHQTRPVPAHSAAGLMATLARAVEHAHGRGVLHRDLKPSNILLQCRLESTDPSLVETGSLTDYEPRITDFSLAKLADGLGPDTKSGVPFGSPPYMAPEQAQGKLSAIGPPTDVYGLGSILYELLTGRPPFVGDGELDILRQVVAEHPIPPGRLRAGLSSDLGAVALKCLRKDPRRRYSTAGALAEDLDRYLAGEHTHARPPRPWETLARRVRRHPAALSMLGMAAVFGIILLTGSRWYDARLQADRRQFAQNQANFRPPRPTKADARALEPTNERHLLYDARIREAARLIADSDTPSARKILSQEIPANGQADIREFSWYYLFQRCHTERRTLSGHRGDVYHVEYSPRGDLLASAGKDGVVLIWDTISWQVAQRIVASRQEVNAASFSPDGTTLATVDDDGKLKLWDVATGRLLLEQRAHTGDAVVARFTPDGKGVITGGRTDGLIRIWDRAGIPRHSLQASPDELESTAISPDGSILATVGPRSIRLWRLPDLLPLGSLGADLRAGAQGVAFSHDGTMLAAGDEGSRLIRLWDLGTGQPRHELAGHTGGAFAVVFSDDDRTLISASADSTILFWDVATGKNIGVQSGHTDRIWNLALSPDGHTLASAGRDGFVKLWNPQPSPEHFRLPATNPVCFELLDDGRTLIALESADAWRIGRWDIHSRSSLTYTSLALTGDLFDLALARDGRRLAVVDQAGRLTLWDTETGARRDSHVRGPNKIWQPYISPDGRSLHGFSSGQLGQSTLLDLQSDREILFPYGHAYVKIFTPTCEVMALLGDAYVCWWNPRTGQSKRSKTGGHTCLDGFLAISADGRTLASAPIQSRKIFLYSTESLELMRELPAQDKGFGSMAFSPDGKTLASCAGDLTVKIWDIRTGEQLLSLGGYYNWADNPRFTSDGQVLVTISDGRPQNPKEIVLWGTQDVEPSAYQRIKTNSPP